jgi:hypothetical protein
MIEILQGVIQFFILFILFLFPITPQINNIFLKKYNFEIFDIICINLVLNLNCYLIISAFKIDLNILFAINFILAIAFLFFHFKKNIIFLKKIEFKVIFLFFIVNISLFFNSMNDLSLMWDGLDHWIYKASAFFQGLGFVNTGNTSYPHLGGFVWGYFWKNSIVQKEYVGRLTFIFFYVSSLFYLINLFKKSNSDIYKLIFIIVILALTYDKKLFGGYQDYLIFSLLIIISKLLYLIINNNGKKIFLETIFFLSAYILCWTKQEGFVYFIITVFLLILFEKEKRKKIFFFFTFFTLTCIYFFLKKFFNSELSFDQKLNINFLLTTNFSLLIQILKTITFNFIIAIFKYPIWIIIVISIILSLTEKKIDYQFRYFHIFLIINIFFVYSLMIHTCLNPEYSCELVSKVSLDRIIFQMSGFYLVFIIIFFANKKIIKN